MKTKLQTLFALCVFVFLFNEHANAASTIILEQTYPSVLRNDLTSEMLEPDSMWQLIYSEDNVINLLPDANQITYAEGGYDAIGNDHILYVGFINGEENFINYQVPLPDEDMYYNMYIRFYNVHDPLPILEGVPNNVRWGETLISVPEEVASNLFVLNFTPADEFGSAIDMYTSQPIVPEPLTIISLLFGTIGVWIARKNKQ